jgi:hypothetical protein
MERMNHATPIRSALELTMFGKAWSHLVDGWKRTQVRYGLL